MTARDLIGGISTGSIIAAGLARAMTVDELQEHYRNIGASVFQPGGLAKFLPKSFQGKLRAQVFIRAVQRELNNQFGGIRTTATRFDAALLKTVFLNLFHDIAKFNYIDDYPRRYFEFASDVETVFVVI